MKLNKKTIAVAAIAALTVIAAAATASISGRLAPGQSETWYGTFSRGWLTVDVDGYGGGDLDMYVYDEDGCLLDMDELYDNDPLVEVFVPYQQQVDIVIVNNGDYTSSYTGTVE